jgi:hypothetical protein
MKTFSGSPVFPFTEMVADTIRAHGLHFAVGFYSRKLSVFEMRVVFRSALGV